MVQEKSVTLTRIAWLSIIIAIGISVIVVVGWASNWLIVAQISPQFIPMPPSTALMFLLLCASWFAYYAKPSSPRRRMFAEASALIVLVSCLIVLIGFLTGIPLDIEQLFLRNASRFGSVLIGRMSPITAAGLVLASASLVMLISSSTSGHRRRQLAAILALLAASIGFVIILGYLFGAPLLYGSSTIPVALTTAIALDFLGIGVCASAGPTCWPIRMVIGPSLNAQLLRGFLPLTIAIVLFLGWFYVVGVSWIGNPALTASLALFFALITVITIASRTAREVGEEIDQTHDALRESEHRYRILFDSTNDAIFIHDMGGRFLEVNQVACERLGYSREDLLRMTPADINSHEYSTTVPQRIEELGKVGHSISEIAQVKQDGIIIPTELSSRIIDYKGKPAVLSIARDITERKHAEETSSRLAAIVESSDDAIIGKTLDGVITSWNQGAEKLYGYSAEEAKGKLISILIPPKHPDELTQILERTGKGEGVQRYETERMRKDGKIIDVSLTVSPIRDPTGRIVGASTIARDITERKRMMNAVRESEERLSKTLASSPDSITVTDLNGIIVECNQATLDMHGFSSRQDLIGKKAFELIAKKDHQKAEENLAKTLEQDVVKDVEYTMLTRDGREFPGELSAAIIRDATGNPAGFVASVRDITGRKKAENALKESEERYKAIFEGAGDGFLAADIKTNKFVFANPKICEMTGYSLKELLELNVNDIHPKEDLPFVIDQFTKQAQGTLDVAKDIPVLRKDKTVLYCDISSKVIEIEGQKRLVGLFRDITERKKIERMKDQFVSMVSHELRTPLTSIRASLGLLASGVSGTVPEKGQRMLEIAVTNTDRLVRLINDILDSERLASAKTPMEKKLCGAVQLVTQAADVMKPMAEKAGVSLSVESQDAELWADPDRIVQALTNLISNAIKFSSKGGKICVAAERKENQMLFKVQDEGRGIPPDKLGLLFERFQQLDSSDARERGGSGLGLSISREHNRTAQWQDLG